MMVAAQRRALESTVQELEQVVAFMRARRPKAYFEARSWPTVETPKMQQEWATKEPVVESRVETLTREVLQLHWEAYYALRRSQANKIAAKRAQEESATRVAAIEADLGTEKVAREAKRVVQEMEKVAWEIEKAALKAQLDQAQHERSQF